MSLEKEKLSCARCHAYLFSEEDDVVYCPICGAPHHRECYNQIGHCALEELHGTDRQYDRVKEAESLKSYEDDSDVPFESEGLITCAMCKERYDFSRNSCPKCGAPNIAKAGGSFVSFDFLGGVPADMDIGEGVTADEAKRFVAANTPRYVPKFASLNDKNKASWNWMAFFFPSAWFLSRKMYKNGIIAGIFTVISTLLCLPLSDAINSLGVIEAKTYVEAAAEIYKRLPEINIFIIAAALVGFFLEIAVMVAVGILGDMLYKKHTISAIKKIKAESEDKDYDYRKKGGVNIFMFFIGTLAIQYVPMIISLFI